MLENRSIQEIEEEKRAKQEEQDCMELYDDKCYTPPLIDKPPPKVRDSKIFDAELPYQLSRVKTHVIVLPLFVILWKVEVIQAELELLKLDEKRKLVRSDSAQIKPAVKTVKTDAFDDTFLKEAKKGIYLQCLFVF